MANDSSDEGSVLDEDAISELPPCVQVTLTKVFLDNTFLTPLSETGGNHQSTTKEWQTY